MKKKMNKLLQQALEKESKRKLALFFCDKPITMNKTQKWIMEQYKNNCYINKKGEIIIC